MAKRRVSYIKVWIDISGPEIWRGQDRQAKSPNVKGVSMRLDKATVRLIIFITFYYFLLFFYFFYYYYYYYYYFLADRKHWLGASPRPQSRRDEFESESVGWPMGETGPRTWHPSEARGLGTCA